jgi:hypothetical protein
MRVTTYNRMHALVFMLTESTVTCHFRQVTHDINQYISASAVPQPPDLVLHRAHHAGTHMLLRTSGGAVKPAFLNRSLHSLHVCS